MDKEEFHLSDFLQSTNKLAYVQSRKPGNFDIVIEPGYEDRFLNVYKTDISGNRLLIEEFIRRKTLVRNGTSVPYPLCIYYNLMCDIRFDSPSTLNTILDTYERENLLTRPEYNGLFLRVIKNYKGQDDAVLHRVLRMYQEAGVALNAGEIHPGQPGYCPEYGYGNLGDVSLGCGATINNLIFAIKSFGMARLPIAKNVATTFIKNNYYRVHDGSTDYLQRLIDVCIDYDIPLYDREADVPGYVSRTSSDWPAIKQVIDIHMGLGLEINRDNMLARNIARWHGLEAIDFILRYVDVESLVRQPQIGDYYHNRMGFMDIILAYRGFAELNRCVSAGVPIPINTFNHVVIGDEPQRDYLRDGSRRFTTEFVCLWRYGVQIAERISGGGVVDAPIFIISRESLRYQTGCYDRDAYYAIINNRETRDENSDDSEDS